jgi:hypothetical protein
MKEEKLGPLNNERMVARGAIFSQNQKIVIAVPSHFPLSFPLNSRAFPCDTDLWFRYYKSK